MNRSVVVVAALVWGGCGIENEIGTELPDLVIGAPAEPLVVTQTDTLLQTTTPQVDILWTIDNSCSMSNEQDDLVENFPFFMNYFLDSGLDYQIGVTSTDTISSNYDGSSGTLVEYQGVKWIDPDTSNAISVFQTMAALGTSGRFPERGLGGTYLCLEELINSSNNGFMRDDAAMHTIVISDESDHTLNSVITQPEFVGWYGALKRDVSQRSFSAIIDPNDNNKYPNSARDLNGIVWELNDDNWPEVLDRLGLQVAGFKREYFLSALPVPGTIEVSVETREGSVFQFDEATFNVDDERESGDWIYKEQRNSIEFIEFVPEELSKVKIHYRLLGVSENIIED